MNIISIGEVLWDVKGDGEYLGGAPLNFAFHLSRLGHQVSMVSAVGEDERGLRIVERLKSIGISTDYIASTPDFPTGWVDVEFDQAQQPEYVIHRPVAYDFPELSPLQLATLFAERVDCIYYGTLLQMSEVARALTFGLMEQAPDARRFYDVNLRPKSYTPELVRTLLEHATVVKLSLQEAEELAAVLGMKFSLETLCREMADRFQWEAMCVTRGEAGCAALIGDDFAEHPGFEVRALDPVGAGDAFAAAFLHGLNAGWPAMQVAEFANRVGAAVVSLPGAVPDWKIGDLSSLQVRPGQ